MPEPVGCGRPCKMCRAFVEDDQTRPRPLEKIQLRRVIDSVRKRDAWKRDV